MKNYLPSILRNRWMLVPIIILLLFGGLRTWAGYWAKEDWESKLYPPKTFLENSPYLNNVPIEEITEAVLAILPKHDWPYSGPTNFINTTFVLPADISYYAAPGDRKPVYVLPKGTRVVDMEGRLIGNREQFENYGFYTLPTYIKGWRYARPFLVAESADTPVIENLDDPRLADLPYYYVRLSDLYACASRLTIQACKKNSDMKYYFRQWYYNPYEMHTLNLLDTDKYLCGQQVYLSKDLQDIPFYDGWNIVLLSAAGVLLTLHVVLRMRRARQQRQVEGGRK